MHAHVAAAVLVVLVASGCDYGYEIFPYPDSGPDAPLPDAAENGGCEMTGEQMVVMQALTFSPKNITIAAGTRVTWVNMDTVEHDVTEGDPPASAPAWSSGAMFPGASWSFDFCDPGMWKYHCSVHPTTMRDATITVEPAP